MHSALEKRFSQVLESYREELETRYLSAENRLLASLDQQAQEFKAQTNSMRTSVMEETGKLVHNAQVSQEEFKTATSEMANEMEHMQKAVQELAQHASTNTQELQHHSVELKALASQAQQTASVLDQVRTPP